MVGDSRKLIAAAVFLVGLIAVINIAWWLAYRQTERMLDNQLSRRLSAIATTTGSFFDPGMVEALAEGNFEAYALAATVLEDVRTSASLSEVFIIDAEYRYLVTTALEEDSTYFLASLNAPYINTLFYDIWPNAVATPSYQTGDIYLKSAFAPLYDSSGFVEAVLGVEADVDYFDDLADLRTRLYTSAGVSLAGGIVLGIVFLFVQRRLNRMQRRLVLSETHSFLGRMVAVVSHEVRNPLMIIRASAERLRKKEDSAESRFIVEEVDRLNDIVSGYLEFTSGGEASFVGREAPEEVHAAELVATVRNHLDQRYGEGQISWIDYGRQESFVFTGFRRPLRQVLLNLLINGAEACRESGREIVVGLRVTQQDGAIALVVDDHGPGISTKVRKRVFEPFFTTRRTGSGLGLYLTRKIVEEMGGRILIEKNEAGGARVVVKLPKRTDG